ncbi:hypothetical protein, partial [Sutcliffiella rhizosphaerae]|uniref:hypothetical protein n=1 Tax=Sutcliffiella rhizosphaerae TaxID=2880967 RepID=UPI00295EEDA8
TKFELYDGNALRIATVGEPPEVKEEQVSFSQISFDKFNSINLDSYDAVFIMKENLSQAAESQYAVVYLNSTIPFIFVSAKSHIPFIVKNEAYSNFWGWAHGNGYTVRILSAEEGNSINSWEFGLYNDEISDEHIKEMYTRIFKKIDGQ